MKRILIIIVGFAFILIALIGCQKEKYGITESYKYVFPQGNYEVMYAMGDWNYYTGSTTKKTVEFRADDLFIPMVQFLEKGADTIYVEVWNKHELIHRVCNY